MLIKNKGLYIGFTGIDGSGKSQQAMLTCGWLNKQKIPNILREGKRDFVSQISTTLALKKGMGTGREYLGEDCYMVSLSFDLLREVILDIAPHINNGVVVVGARTAFCRLAGGIVRGCKTIETAKEIALSGGIPDLIIWLDTSPKIAYKRVVSRGFDDAEIKHLTKYRECLKTLLRDYSHIRIDGDGSITEVSSRIQEELKKIIFQ